MRVCIVGVFDLIPVSKIIMRYEHSTEYNMYCPANQE